MPPVVAEVIDVAAGAARLAQHVTQPRPACVPPCAFLVAFGVAVLLGADVEAIEVVVPPAHRRLDDLVQAMQRVAPRTSTACPLRLPARCPSAGRPAGRRSGHAAGSSAGRRARA